MGLDHSKGLLWSSAPFLALAIPDPTGIEVWHMLSSLLDLVNLGRARQSAVDTKQVKENDLARTLDM